MDTAGFYRQGTSVTHSLAESPFQTPPSTYPAHVHATHSGYGQHFIDHPDLSSVNQKLDRVLAVVLEQKETGRKCRIMCYNDMKLLFSTVAKQEKEIACMKEQLNTVVCEIEQIKDVSSSASETKVSKQPIPREISVSLYTFPRLL